MSDLRITNDDIDNVIIGEAYHVFPGTALTVCCLTLANGYRVMGESACVDPENFDTSVGEMYARADARSKIWMLEGYLLKEKIYNSEFNNILGDEE